MPSLTTVACDWLHHTDHIHLSMINCQRCPVRRFEHSGPSLLPAADRIFLSWRYIWLCYSEIYYCGRHWVGRARLRASKLCSVVHTISTISPEISPLGHVIGQSSVGSRQAVGQHLWWDGRQAGSSQQWPRRRSGRVWLSGHHRRLLGLLTPDQIAAPFVAARGCGTGCNRATDGGLADVSARIHSRSARPASASL